MIDPYKKKFLTNIKKTKWLLETIEKMVEEDRYCMDVAQQVNAALWFLRSANALVLESHLNSCAGHKISSKNPEEKADFIRELLQITSVSNR